MEAGERSTERATPTSLRPVAGSRACRRPTPAGVPDGRCASVGARRAARRAGSPSRNPERRRRSRSRGACRGSESWRSCCFCGPATAGGAVMEVDLRARIRDVPDFDRGDRLQGHHAARCGSRHVPRDDRPARRVGRRAPAGHHPGRGGARLHLRGRAGIHARLRVRACSKALETAVGAVKVVEPASTAGIRSRSTATPIGGARVIVLDDVLATGGTARAKVELVEQLGGVVVGASVPDRADVPDGPGEARRLRRPRADRLLNPIRIVRSTASLERVILPPGGLSVRRG